MKKKISMIYITMMLMMLLASCSNSEDSMTAADNTKVLATIDDAKITQQQVDERNKDSEFSQQEKVFSDKEVLDKLIEEQLLLIKAKELNITMSDQEVKENYKQMLQLMSSKKYIDGDEDKIDKNGLEALRNMFIIQKTREQLGSEIETVLNQLREEVKIEYR